MPRARLSVLFLLAPLALVACSHPEPVYPGVPGGIAQLGPPGIVAGYRLPFNGRWFVQRTHYGNTHDQSFALDLVLPTSEG